MESDFIQTVITQAPNLLGLLIAIWILYKIIAKNQEEIQDRIAYLEHQNQDILMMLAALAERLNSKEVQ